MGSKKQKVEVQPCTKVNFNEALNMGIATAIAVFVGILLKLFALPCWFICGIIAVVAVVTEHFLTLYPLDLSERAYSFCRNVKEKVQKLWKK